MSSPSSARRLIVVADDKPTPPSVSSCVPYGGMPSVHEAASVTEEVIAYLEDLARCDDCALPRPVEVLFAVKQQLPFYRHAELDWRGAMIERSRRARAAAKRLAKRHLCSERLAPSTSVPPEPHAVLPDYFPVLLPLSLLRPAREAKTLPDVAALHLTTSGYPALASVLRQRLTTRRVVLLVEDDLESTDAAHITSALHVLSTYAHAFERPPITFVEWPLGATLGAGAEQRPVCEHPDGICCWLPAVTLNETELGALTGWLQQAEQYEALLATANDITNDPSLAQELLDTTLQRLRHERYRSYSPAFGTPGRALPLRCPFLSWVKHIVENDAVKGVNKLLALMNGVPARSGKARRLGAQELIFRLTRAPDGNSVGLLLDRLSTAVQLAEKQQPGCAQRALQAVHGASGRLTWHRACEPELLQRELERAEALWDTQRDDRVHPALLDVILTSSLLLHALAHAPYGEEGRSPVLEPKLANAARSAQIGLIAVFDDPCPVQVALGALETAPAVGNLERLLFLRRHCLPDESRGLRAALDRALQIHPLCARVHDTVATQEERHERSAPYAPPHCCPDDQHAFEARLARACAEEDPRACIVAGLHAMLWAPSGQLRAAAAEELLELGDCCVLEPVAAIPGKAPTRKCQHAGSDVVLLTVNGRSLLFANATLIAEKRVQAVLVDRPTNTYGVYVHRAKRALQNHWRLGLLGRDA